MSLTNLANAVTVTEKGINNIGSYAALIMSCEVEKLIPLGTTSDYVITIRKSFSKKDADAIMLVYQSSLHNKKVYSPSKDAWLKWTIDEKSCTSVDKTIPSLKDFMKKMSKEYPN